MGLAAIAAENLATHISPKDGSLWCMYPPSLGPHLLKMLEDGWLQCQQLFVQGGLSEQGIQVSSQISAIHQRVHGPARVNSGQSLQNAAHVQTGCSQ